MDIKGKTTWGFPTPHSDQYNPADVSVGTRPKRGIAILMTLMAVAFITTVVAELILSGTVQSQLSLATRNRVKAEFLAKSGFNLAVYLLSIDWGISLYRAQPGTPQPFAKPLADDKSGLWYTLNSLPPLGAQAVSFARAATKEEGDPFKLKGLFSEKIAEQMALFEDSFSIAVSDESSRINVNDCSKGRCPETIAQLTALFSSPAEKAFLESKKISPQELAYRIKDFISENAQTSSESGFTDKNSPYQDQKPPYKVKMLPLDTLNELKLIHGWDDEIHRVFSPYLTTYPFLIPSKNRRSLLNLNTISGELLSSLFPESNRETCAETFTASMHKAVKSTEGLVQDGKNLSQTLKDLVCYTPPTPEKGAARAEGEDENAANTEAQTGSEARMDKTTWFDTKSSTFRVIITADTGDQTRKLETVVKRLEPKDQDNSRAKQEVKRSYQILFWKLSS